MIFLLGNFLFRQGNPLYTANVNGLVNLERNVLSEKTGHKEKEGKLL